MPGPGTYEPKKVIGNDGPQKSFGLKTDLAISKDSRNVPGPGSYNNTMTNLKTMPQYKIGTSTRD